MRNANKKGYHSPLIEKVLATITPEEQYLTDQRMQLAAYLHDCIKDAGFKTRSAFAKAIGQQPSVVSKWLSGTHNFTAETLWLIGRVLDKDLLPVVKMQMPKLRTVVTVYKTTTQHHAEASIAVKAQEHAAFCATLSVSAHTGDMVRKSDSNYAGY